MPSPENPHTERFPAYELAWWKDNAASGREDANAVAVHQYVHGIGRYDAGSFKWPEQQHELERLQRALARAHEFGRQDKAAEVRKVIGL